MKNNKRSRMEESVPVMVTIPKGNSLYKGVRFISKDLGTHLKVLHLEPRDMKSDKYRKYYCKVQTLESSNAAAIKARMKWIGTAWMGGVQFSVYFGEKSKGYDRYMNKTMAAEALRKRNMGKLGGDVS